MKKIFFAFAVLIICFSTSCNKYQSEKQADSSEESETSDSASTPEKSTSPSASPCADLAFEIVSSSPKFVKMTDGLNEAIVKNGGYSYGIGLEGSPDPEKDQAENQSDTYDFKLYESYPDKIVVITRFTFNPTEKQLYQYDIVEDSLIPIEFDKGLLSKMDGVCDKAQK